MKKDIKNKHNYQTRSKGKSMEMTNMSIESSDDDSEWLTDDDTETDIDDIRKIIGDIFPSKYIKNKIESAEKKNTQIDDTAKIKKKLVKLRINLRVTLLIIMILQVKSQRARSQRVRSKNIKNIKKKQRKPVILKLIWIC